MAIKRRVRLAWSLVMSRLFFGVQTWTKFTGRPKSILNAVYMRAWRRIVGDPRFGKTKWSDEQIRKFLGVPSIDAHVRKLRLSYFARVANVNFDALHATLQARTKIGTYLPWVQMVTNDLNVLYDALPNKLGDSPHPSTNLGPYWSLVRSHPREWKAIVRLYSCPYEDAKAKPAD